MNMTYTLTYPTRTEPAMPYELLLAIWLFLCGGAGWLYSSLAKFGLCLGLCVLLMCCKIAVDKNNFVFSKNITMFAVRTDFFNYEVSHHKQSTETKTKGRLTAESAAVLSMPRMESVRRDLPPLFNNQKLFSMRTEKDKSAKSASIGTFVPEIRNLHADSRQGVINGLFNRPINQLVNDFLIEMDAKNQAYYFILENGHFDAFSSYCKNSRKEVCHVNS